MDQIYINLIKGAFKHPRAKWLEKGEKNTSYFFALEKMNYKRNNITSLKMDNYFTSNTTDSANHTDLYSYNYNPINL